MILTTKVILYGRMEAILTFNNGRMANPTTRMVMSILFIWVNGILEDIGMMIMMWSRTMLFAKGRPGHAMMRICVTVCPQQKWSGRKEYIFVLVLVVN